MESFIIEGGHPLQGTITPQGAKNEALQVICTTILTDEPVRITNVPDILDVNNLIKLLQEIGVKVTRNSRHDYTFQSDELKLDYLDSLEFVKKCSSLRGSVLMFGPLLGRFGKATIAKPGGDKIGRRRLDTHFLGFKYLGANFVHDEERNVYQIQAKKLKGCYMLLDEASVTGTANIIMAAVLAKGTTTIYNAACEPYIQQLCHLLNAMGAQISGIASNLLTIVGVEKLHGAEHRILPDMIEVGSFIGMAAMCGAGIRIKDVSVKDLGIIPDAFRRLGVKVKVEGDDLFIPEQKHYVIDSFIDGTIMTLADAPWPGLTPDLLSVLLVVATQARGSVLFHQKMFESRLFFVDKLIDMSAADHPLRSSPCRGGRSRSQAEAACGQNDEPGYPCRYRPADCCDERQRHQPYCQYRPDRPWLRGYRAAPEPVGCQDYPCQRLGVTKFKVPSKL